MLFTLTARLLMRKLCKKEDIGEQLAGVDSQLYTSSTAAAGQVKLAGRQLSLTCPLELHLGCMVLQARLRSGCSRVVKLLRS